LAATPYVVVRDKVTFTDLKDTSTYKVAMVFGAFKDIVTRDEQCCMYGFHGYGVQVPSATTSKILSKNIPEGVAARVRLHRLAVRFVCTGSTGTNTVPDGKLWMGTLRGNVDHTEFATYGDLADFIAERNEVKEYTMVKAFNEGISAVTCPYDFLEWERFKAVADVNPSSFTPDPSLSSIVIALGPNSNKFGFDVQIDAEWTVQYLKDPLMQSLHKHHDSLPEAVWHKARRFVSEHSGLVEDVGIAAGIAGGAAVLPEAGAYLGIRQAALGAMRLGGRAALRALPM